MRRYVVGARPMTLREVLEALGEGPAALAEGRVFVGRKRVRDPSQKLAPGSEVRVGGQVSKRAQDGSEGASFDARAALFEDDDFVSVDKPAGIPTVPSLDGASHSLLDRVAHARGLAPSVLITTSRLDREVSGVVTFAKNPGAAQRITDARAERRHARRYVALASIDRGAGQGPAAESGSGIWDAPIGRHARPLLRAAFGRDAKPAESRFTTIEIASSIAMLALTPVTGRTHQLRVHASHAGAPLVGDRDYGGPTRIVLPTGRVLSLSRIALHCAKVVLPLAAGKSVTVVAPIPGELASLWDALGGSREAWDRASSCA
jgi:23S rRNA pseudouridine1911/1915/1917 synthase